MPPWIKRHLSNLGLHAPLIALILVACSNLPAQTPAQGPTPAIELKDCHLSPPGSSVRMPARCATLSVPEQPDDPASRRIELRIAVIPAISRNPAPDPLFFITGGPGQAATESYPLLSTAFTSLNQKRDIVLVDQRGTGGSNPLDCGEDEQREALETDPEVLKEFLQSCLARLDADPRYYSTSTAVRDLEAVRQVLGYPSINLYGLSYGTRVALEYLRRHPQHVRSLVLDGIIPPEEALGEDVAKDAQRALELILESCQGEAACSQAFPGIQEEFDRLLARLRDEPVSLTIPDPVSGEAADLTFTAEQFGAAVRLLSYTPETAALLPLLIHTAASNNDFQLLAAQYLIVGGDLSRSISQAMGYSVLCSEDAPFFNPAHYTLANRNTYLEDLQIQELQRICEIWPSGEIPPDFKQPVRSNAPTLLLSGEFDPVTPPENAEQVRQTLPNSLHLVAPGQGHNVVFRGCLPRLVTDFVEQGSFAGLDTRCVEDIRPAPFFINFSGPAP